MHDSWEAESRTLFGTDDFLGIWAREELVKPETSEQQPNESLQTSVGIIQRANFEAVLIERKELFAAKQRPMK